MFDVLVVPRASRSEVVGEHNGSLRVRIAAPPVDGAANNELVKVLAKVFEVAKSDVEIVSGLRSKLKRVTVNCSEAKVKETLQGFCPEGT
jgi:uncharacterized protein